MNLGNARIIDETVGTACCWLLSLYNTVCHAFIPGNTGKSACKNILLMKFWGMGSIVLASPAIRAIRNRYPDATISFLTFTGNRAILESLHLVDKIIELQNDNILSFLINLPATFLKLRRNAFDLVIDFEFFTRFSAVTAYFAGNGDRIGYTDRMAYRGNLHTIKIPFDINRHVTHNFCNLARAAGADCANEQLVRLNTDASVDNAITRWIHENIGKDNQDLVAINVNASRLSLQRRWPQSHFIKLIDHLASHTRRAIVMIGAASDRLYVSSILQKCVHGNAIINTAGIFTIQELICLLKQCAVLITNDSGPLHFAASLGVPTISFFGPETPELYGPVGSNHFVFYKKTSCSPCIHAINAKHSECINPKCLEAIDVSQVLAACNTILSKKQE